MLMALTEGVIKINIENIYTTINVFIHLHQLMKPCLSIYFKISLKKNVKYILGSSAWFCVQTLILKSQKWGVIWISYPLQVTYQNSLILALSIVL